MKLDQKPQNWEHRLTLFVSYLIEHNKKSATIKSYISAIKLVLIENNIKIKEDAFLLASLTRACRLINDHVKTRLPIRLDVLCLLLRKLDQYFSMQPYVRSLYRAIFVIGYLAC